MKKIIVLILLLSVWAITVHGSWWNKETELPEPKTEIKVGQIWRNTFHGNTYKVLEVGEKYVVYQWAEGSYKSPDAKVKESFFEDFVLVRDCEIPIVGIEPNTCEEEIEDSYMIDSNSGMIELDVNNPSLFWVDANETFVFTNSWPKPTQRCPVHGIIDWQKESNFTIDIGGERIVNVCLRCLSDLINKTLPQLIEIDPNE